MQSHVPTTFSVYLFLEFTIKTQPYLRRTCRLAINMSPLWGLGVGIMMLVLYVVDLRINGTRQTGAVSNRTYRVELNAVQVETAPTGSRGNIELPV